MERKDVVKSIYECILDYQDSNDFIHAKVMNDLGMEPRPLTDEDESSTWYNDYWDRFHNELTELLTEVKSLHLEFPRKAPN